MKVFERISLYDPFPIAARVGRTSRAGSSDFRVVSNGITSIPTFIEIRRTVFELNRSDRWTDLIGLHAFISCTSSIIILIISFFNNQNRISARVNMILHTQILLYSL